MEMENEDSESIDTMEEYFDDESEKLPTSHTLMERVYDNEITYYCVECDLEYASVEDFEKFHQSEGNEDIKKEKEEEEMSDLIQPSQWEKIDDLIENDEIEEDTAELIKEEYNEDETETNKYYCYDCRTVFNDLVVAEQHDCPGITNEKADVESYPNLNDKEEIVEYMCAFCEDKFKSLPDLEKHQSTNCSRNKEVVPETVQKFKCPICLKEFGTVKALNSHSRTHKSKLSLDQNMSKSKQPAESVCCDICNTTFSTLRSLKLHMRIHDQRPLRSIQHALPEVAAQKYNRLNHFFCEICNKSFDQNLLAIHKNMHQNVEEFICHTCNRQFESKHSFEVHQQVHSTEMSSTTPKIINTAPTEASRRNAKNGIKSTHLANAKQTFPCQYCGHVFWRPHEKVMHERIHTGEKPHECEVCGKRFRITYSLTLHLRTHTDIRPYVCSTCNKRFKSHSVYTHHLRTHLVERAYKCDICDKSFRTSVQLCGHRNSHTKPFNCTLCNRPFASLFAVKAHMKSHAMNKEFENLKHNCNVCGAVYARMGALRSHMIEQHDVKLNTTTNSLALPKQQTIFNGIRSEDEETEIDESALLLITAAADASSRQMGIFEQSDHGEGDGIAVDQPYLNNEELILDSFDTEEVITGF